MRVPGPAPVRSVRRGRVSRPLAPICHRVASGIKSKVRGAAPRGRAVLGHPLGGHEADLLAYTLLRYPTPVSNMERVEVLAELRAS
jgi:hypothetical protein